MNDLDKNFHINFSPLYFVAAFMLFMLWASEARASEIEEVVVYGQQEKVIEADPVQSSTLFSAIMPAFTWNAGGYGGFIGYNERGAQTVHTSVFVNGIPANDPGASWYDFGHDISSGQTVKVVSGANGVVYGSGSIAGTVLIQDNIEKSLTIRTGGDRLIRVAPIDQLELSHFKGSIGSVRTDNNEKDTYQNQTAKLKVDLGDFSIIGKYTEYDYDYDNCYDYDWESSNNCLQDGQRYNVAIRNEILTIGRNYNSADYYTKGNPTYHNESFRDYFRIGNKKDLSKNLNIAFGVDAEKQTYNTISTNSFGETVENYSDENFGGFININASFIFDYNFGIRVGNDDQNALRLGIESGPVFFNIGNSFRKANLYEKYGDGYVDGNEELDPEQGVGVELGYGVLSLFRYDFDETIEYIPGYTTTVVITPATYDEDGNVLTEAVTEDIYTNATYTNTGDYTTQGLRFANNFGPFFVSLKYTDTDQPRVPKYMGAVAWSQDFNDINVKLKYAFNVDREPGPWDYLPEGQEMLDDLNKLDMFVTKQWPNGLTLAFRGENLTDEEAEVVPFYGVQGRELSVTLDYRW